MAALAVVFFAACSDGDKTSETQEMSKMEKDSAQAGPAQADNIPAINPTFTGIDPKISSAMNSMVDHYLHIKTALTKDDAKEAAAGGKALSEAMDKVDKSVFTAEQKKVYEENEEDLREHAEHIGKSPLDHQREHFAMMSEDMYSLVKAFGGGRTLYHDHCPMYNDQKGALWLSETPDIKNPYFGSKMPLCGKVQEKIN